MSYDSAPETYKHIQEVQKRMLRAIINLQERSQRHDQSKLGPEEKPVFDEFTPKLAGMTYGSDEYALCLQKMAPALAHHYAANDHHPEHHYLYECGGCGATLFGSGNVCGTCGQICSPVRREGDGLRRMSLLALLEMICDWAAAVGRHKDGDLRKSIEINQARFGYSDEMKGVLVATARELGLINAAREGEGTET